MLMRAGICGILRREDSNYYFCLKTGGLQPLINSHLKVKPTFTLYISIDLLIISFLFVLLDVTGVADVSDVKSNMSSLISHAHIALQ